MDFSVDVVITFYVEWFTPSYLCFLYQLLYVTPSFTLGSHDTKIS